MSGKISPPTRGKFFGGFLSWIEELWKSLPYWIYSILVLSQRRSYNIITGKRCHRGFKLLYGNPSGSNRRKRLVVSVSSISHYKARAYGAVIKRWIVRNPIMVTCIPSKYSLARSMGNIGSIYLKIQIFWENWIDRESSFRTIFLRASLESLRPNDRKSQTMRLRL